MSTTSLYQAAYIQARTIMVVHTTSPDSPMLSSALCLTIDKTL
jgi:hypothetical protein